MNLPHYHSLSKRFIRSFTSDIAKIFVYFNIFTYSLFKTPHIKLSILHYILLKYQFFLLFFKFIFFTHNNYYPLYSFIIGICEEKNKQLNIK